MRGGEESRRIEEVLFRNVRSAEESLNSIFTYINLSTSVISYLCLLHQLW